jgi:hypothetical protein
MFTKNFIKKMKKIADLGHYVLFHLITEDGEVSTTDVDTVRSITNENGENIDGLYIGMKIILDDEITYKVDDISIFNISEYVQNWKFGMLPNGIDTDSKEYLMGIKVQLSKV